MSGYGGLDDGMPRAALLYGIPIVDTRTVPDERLAALVGLPMVAEGIPDGAPYGSLSYAPLAYVHCEVWRQAPAWPRRMRRR